MKKALYVQLLMIGINLFGLGNCAEIFAQTPRDFTIHVGVLQRILNFDDKPETLFKEYTIGFPIGVTVQKNERWAFDGELVPFFTDENGTKINLLIHPGILRNMNNKYILGLRAAFEIGTDSYGITPLIRKTFAWKEGYDWFVEGVLPIRTGGYNTGIGAGVHVGIGF